MSAASFLSLASASRYSSPAFDLPSAVAAALRTASGRVASVTSGISRSSTALPPTLPKAATRAAARAVSSPARVWAMRFLSSILISKFGGFDAGRFAWLGHGQVQQHVAGILDLEPLDQLKELLAAGIRLEKAEHGRLGLGLGVEVEAIEPQQRLDNQSVFGRIRVLSQQRGACAKQAEARQRQGLPERETRCAAAQASGRRNHDHAEDGIIERKR